MVAYGVAALTVVALAFGLALVVTRAREETVQRLRAAGPAVKRWGGVVLMVLGGWFIALGVFAQAFARLFPVAPTG